MSLLRNIVSGLRSLFRKEQVDRELDEELRAYQEMATEEKTSYSGIMHVGGTSPATAKPVLYGG